MLTTDSHVWIVFQKTWCMLELPRVIPLARGPSNLSIDDENQGIGVNDGSASAFHDHGRPRNISIHVLEKFSRVTKFARETTSQLFSEHHSNEYDSDYRRNNIHTPALPGHPKMSSSVAVEVPHESTASSNPEVIICGAFCLKISD